MHREPDLDERLEALEAEVDRAVRAKHPGDAVLLGADPPAPPLAARSTPAGRRPWSRPRHDPAALAFGAAFLCLGVTTLLRRAGLPVDTERLLPLLLLGLGALGLWSALRRSRRSS